ncbi:hypothetical protein Ddye_024182 [Dipteronia dyeriana]|uniref:Uncharacterized protein n=1 Tax=Dipteronia dyeriana TaxID=168575 RepID=A0AAD9WSQ2_9ROSI|nr:hypothetical protein Ddye_024182 [Dipteronia dyeriana]
MNPPIGSPSFPDVSKHHHLFVDLSKRNGSGGEGRSMRQPSAGIDYDEMVETWELSEFISGTLALSTVISGAALEVWAAKKIVILEDETVDVGIAQFLKWSMRIMATTSIFQLMRLCATHILPPS